MIKINKNSWHYKLIAMTEKDISIFKPDLTLIDYIGYMILSVMRIFTVILLVLFVLFIVSSLIFYVPLYYLLGFQSFSIQLSIISHILFISVFACYYKFSYVLEKFSYVLEKLKIQFVDDGHE